MSACERRERGTNTTVLALSFSLSLVEDEPLPRAPTRGFSIIPAHSGHRRTNLLADTQMMMGEFALRSLSERSSTHSGAGTHQSKPYSRSYGDRFYPRQPFRPISRNKPCDAVRCPKASTTPREQTNERTKQRAAR